jgi:hypothetical protein
MIDLAACAARLHAFEKLRTILWVCLDVFFLPLALLTVAFERDQRRELGFTAYL